MSDTIDVPALLERAAGYADLQFRRSDAAFLCALASDVRAWQEAEERADIDFLDVRYAERYAAELRLYCRLRGEEVAK